MNTLGLSKGVSPLIAGVLLIAFTMSVAVLVGPFLTDVLQIGQEGVDEDVDRVFEAADSNIELINAEYDPGSEVLDGVLRNNGRNVLENFTVTIFGEDGVQQESLDIVLSPGEIYSFSFDVDVGAVEDVEVAVDELPVSTASEVEILDEGSPPDALSSDDLEVNQG